MNKRTLGRSGLELAPLILGGNVFGWTVDEPTTFKLLDSFVAAGLNCVDTADVYSKWAPGNKGGESETLIGKWLHRPGNRQKLIVATKVGSEMSPEKKGLSKSYILRAVEDSLKRLQTDYIDLYQTHYDDAATPVEETLEVYATLIKHGKVRTIGTSNMPAVRIQASLDASKQHGWARYESLQPEYNLYDRAKYETEYEGLCLREGLGVIPYFSLASGFLSGKYRSAEQAATRPRAGMLKKYFNDRGMLILKALDEVAQHLHSTPTAISLAWLMARPSVTAPIASATTLEQMTHLVQATQLKLDSTAIELLNTASAA
jgi:aryl-alcohol dehydrogenase-like predicted oxidoreductase